MKTLHLSSPENTPDGGLLARSNAARERAEGHEASVDTTSAGSLLSVFAPLRLSRRLRHESPDRIVAYSLPDLTTALRARLLTEGAIHPEIIYIPLRDSSGFTSGEQKRIAECDRIRFYDTAAAERFREAVPACEERQIEVTELKPFIGAIAASDRSESTRRLLYCGRLDSDSGFDLIVDACLEALPSDWKFIVAGEGKGRFVMPLIRKCRKSPIEVEWLGEVTDPEKIAATVAGASIVVSSPRVPLTADLVAATAAKFGIPALRTEPDTAALAAAIRRATTA